MGKFSEVRKSLVCENGEGQCGWSCGSKRCENRLTRTKVYAVPF